MIAQQPHMNTFQLVALATTLQHHRHCKTSCFGISKVLQNIVSLQLLTASPIFFGFISNLHFWTAVDYFTFSALENKIWWWRWCAVCLSVTLVYCGQTVALFQLLQCWALIYRPGSAYRYVGQFLPLLLLPHAAQNRGGNCTFSLLPTSMNLPRLWDRDINVY